MNAVQWAKEHEYPAVEIRYDYEGVEKWVTGVWRAKTPLTSKYAAHMQEAAEQNKDIFLQKSQRIQEIIITKRPTSLRKVRCFVRMKM